MEKNKKKDMSKQLAKMSHCKSLSKEDCKILQNLDHLFFFFFICIDFPSLPTKTNHTEPYTQTQPGNLWPASREQTGKNEGGCKHKNLALVCVRKEAWVKSSIVFYADTLLQYPHSPAAEASYEPVFGEVKPDFNHKLSHLPSPCPPLPPDALGSC